MVPQVEMESLLAAHADAVGVTVVRGVELLDMTAVVDDADRPFGMTLTTSEGSVSVDWVVGADGGRSRVRHLTGVAFVGTDPEITGYQAIAELEDAEGLGRGWHHTPTGVYSVGPIPGRILTVQFTGAPDRTLRDQPVTPAELQASIRLVTGHDVTVKAIHGAATRWTDNARQATTYRAGRVLLAGDAAHVHSPFSGQGLNLGAGDAINLGWKLAATINGWAPEGLLDTYSAERHPIGAQVLDWTRAQVALMRGDEKTRQLRRIVHDELLSNATTTTHMVLATSGVAQRYNSDTEFASPVDAGRALVGQLFGDIPFADGTRLADRFHDGTFVLLDRLDGILADVATPWGGRLTSIAEDGATEKCPNLYRKATGMLVRPDGVIAWATESTHRHETAETLRRALLQWAGQPS